MAAATRSRKGVRLSSIHASRRTYPKPRPADLQFSQTSSEDSIAALLTPLSPDVLPEHVSPVSPKFHRSRVPSRSLSALLLSWNNFRIPHSRSFWIVLYFFLNFSLTLYNKIVMNRFPFPYSMTALHALAGCIGTRFVMRPEDRVHMLSAGQTIVLVSFSILYTLNIVVSNVSLQLVTVPFHQVIRSSAPFFTLTLSAMLLRSPITRWRLISLIPVVVGVALATYGDYYYTLPGFVLTLFGTFLASLKTVVTNILQSPHYRPSIRTTSHVHQNGDSYSHAKHPKLRTSQSHNRSSSISITVSYDEQNPPNTKPVGRPRNLLSHLSSIPKLHLTSIQLLHFLSPLAFFQCILLALYSGELSKIFTHVQLHLGHASGVTDSFSSFPISGNANSTLPAFERTPMLNRSGVGFAAGADAERYGSGSILPGLTGLIVNALMAFALNVVSFHTNRKVGALGMSVAGNVKQVLTVLSSVVLFNLTITKMNAAGILLTLIGGAWYASVDLHERGKLR